MIFINEIKEYQTNNNNNITNNQITLDEEKINFSCDLVNPKEKEEKTVKYYKEKVECK